MYYGEMSNKGYDVKQGPVNKIKFNTIETCREMNSISDLKKKNKLKQKVAAENLGLVTHTIQKYFKQMATHLRKKGRYDELVSEGTIGLMRAVEMFDPNREVKFSTYAVPWIKQSIRKYLNSAALNIPAGDAAANLIWRYRKVHGNTPVTEISVDKIMADDYIRKGLSEKTIRQYLKQLEFRVVNLDNLLGKVTQMEENKTHISSDELDVKSSLDIIWKSFSREQKNKLTKFCESAGGTEDGAQEYEQLVFALCRNNGSNKKPKELISKGFCDALLETVSKLQTATI